LPTIALTGACWQRHSPVADRATICKEAVVESELSAATITNWRVVGCLLDSD
jgi:hypothetical protein